jgi:hypothetical protein
MVSFKAIAPDINWTDSQTNPLTIALTMLVRKQAIVPVILKLERGSKQLGVPDSFIG